MIQLIRVSYHIFRLCFLPPRLPQTPAIPIHFNVLFLLFEFQFARSLSASLADIFGELHTYLPNISTPWLLWVTCWLYYVLMVVMVFTTVTYMFGHAHCKHSPISHSHTRRRWGRLPCVLWYSRVPFLDPLHTKINKQLNYKQLLSAQERQFFLMQNALFLLD